MDKIKGRLSEPSTWAGIAAILEALKLVLPGWAVVITGVQAVAGSVAVVVRERGAL